MLVLAGNPRKKESMISELARGRVSKFSTLGNNRMLVVKVAIVKLRFFHSGFSFTLRIVKLNPQLSF